MNKVIKTLSDYEAALISIENLIDIDPEPNTPEFDQLELLVLLVNDYESKQFEINLPSPIDAILFRMEQQGLTHRDLIPYLGSRSKVSEVLSGKRSLSISMIRALNSGLGIPAKVLLQEESDLENDVLIDWLKFPLKEMASKGWIQANKSEIKDQGEELLRSFFAPLDSLSPSFHIPLLRRTKHIRSGRKMDEYALIAWTARVMTQALETPAEEPFVKEAINLSLMQELAKLSIYEDGPLLAQKFLSKNGIILVIEPHLSKTYLDGAALMINKERPVIGLTLRIDRIDNFWFSLMHELAHISLHFDEEIKQFFDDLGVDQNVEYNKDYREIEADELAGEALIPAKEWKKSPASKLRSPDAAESLSKKLGIHPAIVAGRMRHEFKAHRLFSNLVGHNEVRKHFSAINWDK